MGQQQQSQSSQPPGSMKEDTSPHATPDGQESDPAMQGEGNRSAARRYNEETTDFARSGRVEEAARDAQPKDDAEAADMERAEQEGLSKAREEDPSISRSGQRG